MIFGHKPRCKSHINKFLVKKSKNATPIRDKKWRAYRDSDDRLLPLTNIQPELSLRRETGPTEDALALCAYNIDMTLADVSVFLRN